MAIAKTRPGRQSRNRPKLGRIGSHPPLVEQVVQRLRQSIVRGEFTPEQQMPPEASLCETLGVSRTVVREAMRILRAQGLVEVSQGRRPRIRPVDARYVIDGLTLMLQRSETTLLHLAEWRRPMESEIAALAAERATPDQIERMATSIRDLGDAPDLAAQAEADLRFHSILAEATGNPIFQLILQTIWSLQHESRMKTIAFSRAAVAIHWHERILKAVRAKDPQRARSEMAAHIDASRRDLVDSGTTGKNDEMRRS